MMTDAQGRKADPRFISDLKAWRAREAQIIAGAVIPTRLDRLRGHSAFSDSGLLDLRQLVAMEIARDQHSEGVLDALRRCSDLPFADHCFFAADLATAGGDHDLADVLHWHAAIRAHDRSIHRLLADALATRRPADPVGWAMWLSVTVGLAAFAEAPAGGWVDDGIEADIVAEVRERGMARIGAVSDLVLQLNRAADEIDGDGDAPAGTPLENALAGIRKLQESEAIDDMLEDRAELQRMIDTPPSAPTLTVVAGLPPDTGTAKRREIAAAFRPIIGKALPLVGVDRIASARIELLAAFPHLATEIDLLLGMQSARQWAHWRVLLVGEPGAGKTSYARELAHAMGVPSMTYACGGASDSAFGGTSAQYSSQRASVPLQLVGRSETANPLIVLDELDKIASGKHNGSLEDALLAFLEPTSSSHHHDLALEMDVDLSAVSYVATANNLDDVPAPLRDRFKIVRIPEPGWEHVGVLSRRIIDDLARQRGLDPRWYPELAPDELEIIKTAWPGGSLRRLTRAVTTLIDGRERFLGRA